MKRTQADLVPLGHVIIDALLQIGCVVEKLRVKISANPSNDNVLCRGIDAAVCA